MSRGGRGDSQRDPGDFDWPDAKPAFPSGAVSVASNGHAWVRRHRPAGEAPLYDIFDDRGRRLGQVELPEGRSLVGFGEESVYLMRSDDFDFAWLEKYEAPSF